MSEQNPPREMDDLVRHEVAAWSPRQAPDMHDVLRRADQGWQRSVAASSGLAAVALALVLMVALAVLIVGSHFTFTDDIRERLLAH